LALGNTFPLKFIRGPGMTHRRGEIQVKNQEEKKPPIREGGKSERGKTGAKAPRGRSFRHTLHIQREK